MPTNVHSVRGRGSVILLVEEDATERQLCRLILERGGYCVLEAKNGAEAWEIAQRYQGRIHVLVTDVQIPKIDGYELSSRVAQVRPEAKTVFISSSAAVEGTRVIARPLLPKMLVPTVGAALAPQAVLHAGA